MTDYKKCPGCGSFMICPQEKWLCNCGTKIILNGEELLYDLFKQWKDTNIEATEEQQKKDEERQQFTEQRWRLIEEEVKKNPLAVSPIEFIDYYNCGNERTEREYSVIWPIIRYLETIIPRINDRLAELEKPKYACPNCHRVVDELLIFQNGIIANYIITGGENCEPIELLCKHCAPEVK